jgi:hypothetical protein
MPAAIQYAFPAVTDESDPGLRVCPMCGSPNVIDLEGSYATGLTAPDGTVEIWHERGVLCVDCGQIEEA